MAARRRAAGIVPVNRREREMPLSLPAEPFAAWLRAYQPGSSNGELAIQLGCDETFIRRHINGEYERIHIDRADRILLTAGAHLNDIYPYSEIT
jgi:hypothetical protein